VAESGVRVRSSRERNRAYRKQERTCLDCEQPAVIKGKAEYGAGWLCWRKKGGCGAKFPDGDQRIEAQQVGEIENPDLPDTWNAVDKMAKKRGYVDAVLSVTGASAIFTQDIGADPTETGADSGPEHGPVVAGELKQAATQAAIRLCAGGLDEAKALWQRFQARLDGYRGRRRRARDRRRDRQHPVSREPRTRGGEDRRRQRHTARRAAGKRPGDRRTDTPRRRRRHARPGERGGRESARAPARRRRAARPQLARLAAWAIAAGRGVSDAELANLIRNAVAQGPIPAERARAALPEMLARITEEIAARTIELVEMFYPPANTASDRAAADATSVDFAAVEPPQAA
jgi:hypothetical protein